MESTVITTYIDKIYQFAWNKSFDEEEAEELSQEILYAAVKSLPLLRDESRFEPWLWSLAQNTARTFRRKQGRQRAMFVYDAPEMLMQERDLEDVDEELYAKLREKIAMLSKMYRDIIILHYYEGLSTKAIAGKLGLPIGTVTWRLSEARNKLKKECSNMEETALRPVNMEINIYGSGNYDGREIPFPCVYIRDALSQNILFHCYESPKGIEELANICGVPAYYVEERMENLMNRQAVVEVSKGRYQTDFIIWTDKYGKYCEENAEAAIMPVMEKMITALESLYQKVDTIDFYRAGKSADELKYLYGVMAFYYLSRKYNTIAYPETIPNYDGNRWRYIANMESGKYRRTNIGHQISANIKSGGSYKHEVYIVPGFEFRRMMQDKYISVCEDILTGKRPLDAEIAAHAIKDGYIIRKDNGELWVNIPAFTKEQKAQFDEYVDELFSPLMEEYAELVNKYITGYKKLFPKHLADDAQRMCRAFFVGFYDTVSTYCVKKGMLVKPEKNWICDVLLEWDGK